MITDKSNADNHDSEKVEVTLPGVVEKVIPSPHPSEPEKAQIAVEGADELYREIRVENTLQDGDGNEVKLKEGAEVQVKIAADPDAVSPKDAKPDDKKQSPQFAKDKRASS